MVLTGKKRLSTKMNILSFCELSLQGVAMYIFLW